MLHPEKGCWSKVPGYGCKFKVDDMLAPTTGLTTSYHRRCTRTSRCTIVALPSRTDLILKELICSVRYLCGKT